VCYSDDSVTAQDIVEAALAARLEVMAVTDHNTIAGVDDIRKAAEKHGLYIFPGVELTTQDGHFLALFETDISTDELVDFLDYSGINRNGWGDAHTVAGDETIVTLKKVHERGGIAIAAHIDRWPSGFMETKATRKHKREIHESEYLDALEITIPQTRHAWKNGETRDFPLKRACIQGSDAHNPEEIARRPVYIRMETVSLGELKKAFSDYENNILFPDDIYVDA